MKLFCIVFFRLSLTAFPGNHRDDYWYLRGWWNTEKDGELINLAIKWMPLDWWWIVCQFVQHVVHHLKSIATKTVPATYHIHFTVWEKKKCHLIERMPLLLWSLLIIIRFMVFLNCESSVQRTKLEWMAQNNGQSAMVTLSTFHSATLFFTHWLTH